MYYVCLLLSFMMFFFFKQKTAYEMRISDWSSDVCSSDLDQQQIVLHAKLGHSHPVALVEHAARWHRRRHQQHRAHLRPDSLFQRGTIQLPFAPRLKAERPETRNTTGQPYPVDQPGIGRVGDDPLVTRLTGRPQHSTDARPDRK